jgi:ribonuclease HII
MARASRPKRCNRQGLEGKLEEVLWGSGLTLVAGVDEAGRGPIAGPVVAAAVVLTPDTAFESRLDDSKVLTQRQRLQAYEEIRGKARAVAWSCIPPRIIDGTNILAATLLAMTRAIRKIDLPLQRVMIDGPKAPGASMFEEAIVNGDSLSISVASASIVAKVIRDSIMTRLDKSFPMYGFAEHKGYCTPGHLGALARYGPCRIHRRTFHPICDFFTPAQQL